MKTLASPDYFTFDGLQHILGRAPHLTLKFSELFRPSMGGPFW